MLKILLKPYPLESFKARLIISMLISVFVYLFLVTLEPFDLNRLNHNKFIILLGYGAMCLIVLILFYSFLPKLLPRIFDEARWKVYKQIIWYLCCLIIIGFVITIYEDIVGIRQVQTLHIVESILKTTLIGIIPLSAITFYNQIRLLKKHLAEANDLSENVASNTNSPAHSTVIQIVEFKSENKKESYSCNITDLLCISAMENYIVIHTISNMELIKTILRSTLTQAEKDLKKFPEIFRCHRAHLVNLNRIKRIDGNARGYELFFDVERLIIPVSRGKTTDFRTRIKGK